MPVVMDSVVESSAYRTAAFGGERRTVRLSNGWLVASTHDSDAVYDIIRFEKSVDNGVTWQPLCYIQSSSANYMGTFSIVSYGTTVYGIFPFNNIAVYFYKFDASVQENINLVGTGSLLDSGLTNVYHTTIAIKEDGTKLAAAWTAQINSTSAPSLRWSQTNISALNGSVSWMVATQLTSSFNTNDQWLYPSMVYNSDGRPVINCIFYTSSGGQQPIYAVYSLVLNAGFGWDIANIYTSTRIQNPPSSIFIPQVIAKTNRGKGRIWNAWLGLDDIDTGKFNVRVSYSDDGGITWSAMHKITSGSVYTREFITITANRNNEVFIIFSGTSPTSNGAYYLRMIKWSDGVWGEEIDIGTYSALGSKTRPSALVDLSLSFTTPLVIYQDLANNKVGFHGEWSNAKISTPSSYLGVKSDRQDVLTYSITDNEPLGIVIEKLNGVVIGSKNLDVGEQSSITLSQEQWDSVNFGKYTKREIPLPDSTGWAQGLALSSTGSVIVENSDAGMIRLKKPINIYPHKNFELTVADGYQIMMVEVDSNNIVLGYSGWLTGVGRYTLSPIAHSLYISIIKTGSSSFTPVDVNDSSPVLFGLGSPNIITIETGISKWFYTFDKRLRFDDDVLSIIKALKDVQELLLPDIKGRLSSMIRYRGGSAKEQSSWDSLFDSLEALFMGVVKGTKKFASGNVTSSNSTSSYQAANGTNTVPQYSVAVAGLDFLPSLIIIKSTVSNQMTIYRNDGYNYSKIVFSISSSLGVSTSTNAIVNAIKADVQPASVAHGGFYLPVHGSAINYTWLAFK